MSNIVFDVKKHKDNMIQIITNSHKEVINAVSNIPNKRFNPINRSYLIPRNESANFLNALPSTISEESRFELEKISRTPLKHQIEAKEFLLDRKKCILADGMGFGKTFSSIIACNELKGRKLIICPSGLKLNWKKEIRLITDSQIDIIQDGKNWIEPTEDGWTILSYDMLQEHMETILVQGYTVSVFDEAHYCRAVTRNGLPKSDRAKSLISISENTEYLFLLTGTPVVNGNKDLFVLLKAIGHYLGSDWRKYSLRYCGLSYGIRNQKRINGNSNEEELFNILKHRMLRRVESKFLNIPNQTRNFIPIDVNLEEYNNKIKDYMIQRSIDDDNGRHLVFLNAMRNTIAREKVDSTIKLANELLLKDEQVVIFTNYDYVVNKVLDYYGDDAVRVTGKDSTKERQKSVDNFQDGKKKVIVCNIIAGGVGITLIKARHLIFNDLSWLPSDHLQAEKRISRIGQMQETHVHYLYSKDSIDEKMINILEKRMNSIGKTLNGTRESLVGDISDMFT